MSQLPIVILNQLKSQVLNLVDDLLDICPQEQDILFIRFFFENHVSPLMLMECFIKYVHPWKEYIVNRNEEFFEKNENIFGPLPKDKVLHFKQKFQDGTFVREDKAVIWDYFNVFITLIEKYKKVQ